MQNYKVIPFLLILSASSVTFASGNHGGGHGHAAAEPVETHWMAPKVETARHNPVQATTTSVNAGANLYQQNCMSCHGVKADGKGMAGAMMMPKPANLRVMAGTHSDGDFAYKIKQGRGGMPAWKNSLSDHQVWHLVNFIQALDKKPVANQQGSHSHTAEHAHDL